jgi:hypothetical protein
MVAWHSIRAHRHAACLLGMPSSVADVIVSLSITDIDRIAERCYPYARPRWEDRPAVWRQLLLSAERTDPRAMREACLRGIQLVTGGLISPSASLPKR